MVTTHCVWRAWGVGILGVGCGAALGAGDKAVKVSVGVRDCAELNLSDWPRVENGLSPKGSGAKIEPAHLKRGGYVGEKNSKAMVNVVHGYCHDIANVGCVRASITC